MNSTVLPVFILAVSGLSAQTLPGVQDFHERFMDYAVIASGPRALAGPALEAAIRMLDTPAAYPSAWKDGPGGFGRHYGDSLARHGARESARFAVAAILHEDFRYRRSQSGNPLARAAHALAFTFVDRSDSGSPRLAFANLAAAGADGLVGELYLPRGFTDASHAQTRIAVAIGNLAGENLLLEFSPEIIKILRKAGIRSLDLPVPEWWVRR